ncbi:Septum formation protein Maf [Koleobacter methoxysyntrophicus]|uniref:dTTP/UTP pyrophosphatase n=1 Tax=Koleobacter methoxysyntrophicus TaxID=2751313 RepID=A0A8A0RQ48_9FIRM|nr:Maf family protein [Koleobacter methoxysyntrophicus]QSQ09527.1 Septum formation protein Maf [Koleobacter methoxysyntrophicus]
MKKIILASASPRRKQLLEQMKLKFEVIPSNIFEDYQENREPEEVARDLAERKATDIARISEDSLVIGADTVVFLDEILGKPKDEREALKILKKLSGKTHYVITGIAVIDSSTKKLVVDHEKTAVKMKKISEEEIKAYISTGEPMDKAGAYGIQGLGSVFVEEIHGCYFNVVGLPISKLYSILKGFGVDLFKEEVRKQDGKGFE